MFSQTILPLAPKAFLQRYWEYSDAPSLSSEKEGISLIHSVFANTSVHAPKGRGDDCAELHLHGSTFVLSTDVFLEGQHFRREYFTPEEVGYKALAQAASDIAAAGAVPLGFSLALMVPSAFPLPVMEKMLQGLAHAASTYSMTLVGGDLSVASQLGLSVTVWGESATPQCPMFLERQQAKPDDILFLVGSAGLARVGLTLLEEQGRQAEKLFPEACHAHLRPTIHCSQARLLVEIARQCQAGEAVSLMDVSDGLAQDIPRLLGPYGAALTFSPEDIPVSVRQFAQQRQLCADTIFLKGGEDYSLLGTVPSRLWEQVQSVFPSVIPLGIVTSAPGVMRAGAHISYAGFDHFQEDAPAVLQEEHTSGMLLQQEAAAPALCPGCPEDALLGLACVREAMETLTHVCRAAWERGLLAGFNGNASMRVQLPAEMRAVFALPLACVVITATGAAKGCLKPSDFSVLDVETGRVIAGGGPSSESLVHLAIYQKCSETQAVLHTHPPHMLALCMALPEEERLALPLFEADAYRAHLGWTPSYAPGSSALAQAVGAAACHHKAVWMEQHGLVTHASQLPMALGLMEELEQLARIQLLARGIPR